MGSPLATKTTGDEEAAASVLVDVQPSLATFSQTEEMNAASGGAEEEGGTEAVPAEAARSEERRPAGGLLANLDLSLAEFKLSDSPKKKKITKVKWVCVSMK